MTSELQESWNNFTLPGGERERAVIQRLSSYATLCIANLRSICPASLLEEDRNKNMPWLTDNVSVLTSWKMTHWFVNVKNIV